MPASGKDINIEGSNVASEAGKADMVAENNINIANATEYYERLLEEHNKVIGFTGRTLNKSDLRSEYSGGSVNFNKTALGI